MDSDEIGTWQRRKMVLNADVAACYQLAFPFCLENM